jgi:hypothetical protein
MDENRLTKTGKALAELPRVRTGEGAKRHETRQTMVFLLNGERRNADPFN